MENFDLSGLQPIDDAPKALDTSKLKPLDLSGLKPIDDMPGALTPDNALYTGGQAALRATPGAVSGLAGFGLMAPIGAEAGAIFGPIGAGVGGLIAGTAGAFGLGTAGNAATEALVPLSDQEKLNRTAHPTAAAVGEFAPNLAMFRPSPSMLASAARLEGPALAALAKGGAINTGIGASNRVLAEATKSDGNPFNYSHVFDPVELAKDATLGALFFHKPTMLGRAAERPGTYVAGKILQPFGRGEFVTNPGQTGQAPNATSAAFEAAAQPAATETPVTSEPAFTTEQLIAPVVEPAPPVAPVAPEGPVVMPEATTPVAPSPSSVFTPPAPVTTPEQALVQPATPATAKFDVESTRTTDPLAVTRIGEQSEGGNYYGIEGQTQYEGGNRHTIKPGSKVANLSDPAVADAVIDETLKDPNLTPEERARLEEAKGQGDIDYMLFDETPMADAARRLGLDAVKVIENQDMPGSPSSVFVLNNNAVEAVKPQSPERQSVIDRILHHSRVTDVSNDYKVVPSIQLKGSNGNWYSSQGFPHGVNSTGEKRIAGYVYESPTGGTFGKLYPTEAEAKTALENTLKSKQDQFRQSLESSTDERLKSQDDFWKSEFEKKQRLTGKPLPAFVPKPVAEAPKPVVAKPATVEANQIAEPTAVKEPQGVQDARVALAKMEASGNGESNQANARRVYILKWEKANGRKPSVPEPTVKPAQPEPAKPVEISQVQAPVTPEPVAQQPTVEQPVAQPKRVVNPPASTEGGAIRNTDNIPVVKVNTAEIKADPKLMQYKATDEAATGVNAKDKLTGTWDDTKAGTLVVWQPENPSQYGLTPGEKYIVANGHHRLDFAQRAGRENLNVQILKESDGWSALDARRQAAEINIADGKGSPQDAVKYLQAIKEKSGDKAMEAAAKRIGSNEQARRNIDIAKGLTGEALDLFINEKIDANQARAIALHSPGDAAIQNAGAKAAVKGMKPETVVDVMNSIKSIRDERLGAKKDASEQTTMFEQMGWDVGKEQEIAEKLAMKVAEKRSAIDDKLAAVSSAAKRPEKAGAGGVKVENVEKTKAYIESLKAERDSLERWRDIPELKKQIYDEAGITRADEEAAYGTQPKAETQPKVETPGDTQTQIPGTSVEENYSMAGEKAVEPKTYAEMTPEEQLAYRNQNDTATGDMFGSYRVFEGDLSAQRKQKIAAEKEASDVSSLSDDANKILKQIPENSPHEDRFGTPMSEMNLDPSVIDSVADARDAIRQRADDIAPHYPEVAKQLREVLSPKEQPKVDRNPKTDARKADELDRRVDVNAANRAADSEARKGYQGIVDRAIFEARKNKNISEKEIQGLTRILNYIGGRFFEGVKLSIKEGPESQMGQYDAANRIVTIFKDAIRTGRFEETAAHEVAHHLAKFLPEADRIALRKEWQSARDKYLKENPGFASLVGDRTADWNTVRIKGTDIQAAAKIYPDLNKTRYFTQIPGGKEPMFKIAATDEAYRLFNANEWFAETFKESARARLESDPTYTGEPKTWKDKLVGLWETIKTNFRQLFGKDQANKILSNFIKGKYVAEETSSPDVHAQGHETFNLSRDSIDNPSTVETEIKNNQKPEVSVGGKVYRSVSDAAPVKFFKSIATRMRAVASNNPQSEAVKQIVNDFALTPGTKGDAAKTDYNTDVSRQREVFTNRLSLALGGILKDVKAMTPEQRTRFNDLFVRAIEGRLPNEVGGATGKSVKEVKAILEEMHQYGLDAGLDIGKVSEYFPRATNYDAVVADPEGFVKAAAKAYEMKWERQQKEASNGQTTMDLGAEAKPDFKEQARKWRDAILLGEEGIDFERGIFDESKSSNVENFQKERVFTPEEAEQFDAFREKDIATLLSRYTGSLVRRAEVARRLGVKGEGWADAKKRMYEEGVSADDIKELEKSLKSNLGVTSVQLDPSQRVWMDVNNLVVTAAYLRNTGLLNLVEPGAIGVRTGNALDTPRILAQNLLRVRNVLARLTPAETKAAQTQIEAIYGKGHDIYSALALEMGLTSVHDGISSPSVGFHGDEGISSSGKMREAVDNIHRLYGIHATEVAKRETSLREGSRFIDKTISWALGENGMQKAFGLTKDTRLATDRLAELGINESEIPEFSKWVKDMRALDSDAQLQRIMDRNDPMAAKYRNALGVFSKQSVVQATSASKQIASKDTPLGRLFFQLSTYVNEWSSQQGRYLGETAKNIVGKNGYSGTERLMAAGSLGAFALLSAGYYGLGEIRKLINGHKEKELKPGDYPHWVKDSADAVMYTGIAGPGEMVWKAIERGQMPAGVLGNMAGQSIKAAKEFADNPDSNAKQRNVAKLAYRVGVVPAVNTALASVGGPIPAVAAQVVAGSRTEKAVADAIAGEPPSKSGGIGPRPPQPHQPKPPRPGK